ncbi:AAA family ATPase, partial [Novosphingobium sp. 1949]|nr:AAA family ATPase [Novosphingobium organovorum]
MMFARSLLLRFTRGADAAPDFRTALREWALPKLGWLTADACTKLPKNATWATVLARVEAAQAAADAAKTRSGDTDARPSHAIAMARALAGVLGLEAGDARLLEALIGCARHPHLRALIAILTTRGTDLACAMGLLAGFEEEKAEARVRTSAVLRLGLVGLEADREGGAYIALRWALTDLLDRQAPDAEAIVGALAGPRQTSALELDDFAHVADRDFLVRLLAGALRTQARGVNILIHGPPGTGKTELARVLAAEAGAALHAVGETDEAGDEPNRYERVHALHLAQRVLGARGDGSALLLFDEMEDFIGDAAPSGGDWFARRSGSKVFVNRLIESNAVPVIWTTNALGNVDDAIVRRMSFVLRLDTPPRSVALRMLARVAADEGGVPGAAFADLIERAPET